MIQINNLKLIEKTEDEESGDIYYTAEVELMEPGAAFEQSPSKKEITQKLEKQLNQGLQYLKQVF